MPITPDALKRMLVAGSTVALQLEITGGALVERFTHINSKIKLKLPHSASEAAGGENQDILSADGSTVRFPKYEFITSGLDESDITPAGSSSTATGEGEIEITAKEAPYNTDITTFTGYIKKLQETKSSKFLNVVPLGLTYHGRGLTTPKVDGWAFMIGKKSSDIEMDYDNNAKELAVNYLSNSDDTIDASDITSFTYPAIPIRAAGVSITPPTPSAPEAADILAGKVVIIPTTY